VLVTGLTLADFTRITAEISDTVYDGNVIVHGDAHALSGNRFRARLRVKNSYGQGARTSSSYLRRHTPAACWHAYRDVLEAVFAEYPDARVQTSMATYKGRDGFRDKYSDTAYVNIGSQMYPACMPELCEC